MVKKHPLQLASVLAIDRKGKEGGPCFSSSLPSLFFDIVEILTG